jgi:hypothetical protein
MKIQYSLVLVIFLAQFSSLAQSECLPVACYVEKVRVLSCRSVSEVVVSGTRLEQLGIRQKQAQAILNHSSTVVIQGRVSRSRYVAKCAEPDTQRFVDNTMMREYLVSNASCADYPLNYYTEGFVTTPCCDTLPVDSAECLLTMETMGPLPTSAQ